MKLTSRRISGRYTGVTFSIEMEGYDLDNTNRARVSGPANLPRDARIASFLRRFYRSRPCLDPLLKGLGPLGAV